MRTSSTAVFGPGSFLVLAIAALLFPIPTTAQQGQDAVYNSQGSCSPCAASPAFFDASQFAGNVQNPNFCSVLNYILTPSHGVIPSGGWPRPWKNRQIGFWVPRSFAFYAKGRVPTAPDRKELSCAGCLCIWKLPRTERI